MRWKRPELPACALHDLHYDPRRATGCVLCRRSAPAPTPLSGLWTKLALLLSIGALVAFANRAYGARGEASREAPEAIGLR